MRAVRGGDSPVDMTSCFVGSPGRALALCREQPMPPTRVLGPGAPRSSRCTHGWLMCS